MAGIPARYWRVCDRCGEIVSIASDNPNKYICGECGATAAWEYTTQSKALQQSRDIQARAS